jgi:hypothetical protein
MCWLDATRGMVLSGKIRAFVEVSGVGCQVSGNIAI